MIVKCHTAPGDTAVRLVPLDGVVEVQVGSTCYWIQEVDHAGIRVDMPTESNQLVVVPESANRVLLRPERTQV